MTQEFLPGCYRNIPCWADESFAGYLLRLAEANGYAGIRDLLKAASIEAPGPISRLLRKVRLTKQHLESIGAMAIGDAKHLARFLISPIGDEAVFILDCRVDNDAILEERCQVCPTCLAESGYCKESWDFATITTCPLHFTRLQDKCAACATRISWTRPSLMHCFKCGSDFREASRIEVKPQIVEVTNDFGALAPFRFGLNDGACETYPWDTAFRLFKTLALPVQYWGTHQWPEQYVRLLDVEARHLIVGLFAEIHKVGQYKVGGLHHVVSERLAPLSAIPRPNMVESYATRFLFSVAALPNQIAESTCYAQPPAKVPRGAQLFNGRPPSFTDLKEVASFLSVDRETVAGLLACGVVERPDGEHIGYDIDQILDAQRFLSNGLLSIGEVAMLVGVPLDWHEHGFDDLLPIWNRKHPTDVRVAVEHLASVQLHLAGKWRAASPPKNPVSLRCLAERSNKPFQTVALTINKVLSGGINRIAWGPAFDWASLQLDESDIEVL